MIHEIDSTYHKPAFTQYLSNPDYKFYYYENDDHVQAFVENSAKLIPYIDKWAKEEKQELLDDLELKLKCFNKQIYFDSFIGEFSIDEIKRERKFSFDEKYKKTIRVNRSIKIFDYKNQNEQIVQRTIFDEFENFF